MKNTLRVDSLHPVGLPPSYCGRVGMLDRCQRQKQPRTEKVGRRQRQIKEGRCCPDLLRPTPPTPPDRVRLPEGRRGIWGGGGGGEAADTETSEGGGG